MQLVSSRAGPRGRLSQLWLLVVDVYGDSVRLSIFSNSLQGGNDPHVTDEETEARKEWVMYLRSHRRCQMGI